MSLEEHIHKAVAEGDVNEITNLIAEHGKEPVVNIGNPTQTPLMTAVMETELDVRVPMTKLLLDNGANVNATDENNLSPLNYAVLDDDNEEVIKLLLDTGANVDGPPRRNVAGEDYETPLMIAAAANYVNIVKILVGRQARLDLEDNEGNTARAIARNRGLNKILKVLNVPNNRNDRAKYGTISGGKKKLSNRKTSSKKTKRKKTKRKKLKNNTRQKRK